MTARESFALGVVVGASAFPGGLLLACLIHRRTVVDPPLAPRIPTVRATNP